jgi:hypothetical protein
MVYSFAGGVRDTEGRQGYVSVGPEVVAVELANGAILWRRKGIGRPIAATPRRLLTLDQDGKNFVLRLFNAATGSDAGRVANFGMPDWAQEAGMEADAVHIEASENPAGIEISWRLRRPYRGGAPPPARIAAQARNESTGAILIDPESAQVVPTPTPAVSSEEAPPAPAAPGPYAPPTPDVVAVDRIGDRLFVLKVQERAGQAALVTLEARDAQDGSTVWEAPLAEVEKTRPKPQRK